MNETVFHGWDSFYVIIGSAAAGLIGLLFVVVTLTSGFDRDRALRAIGIYTTPTVVHLAVVLTTSAIAMAPRVPVSATAVLFGIAALVGLAHSGWSCIGTRKGISSTDPPHWSDFWLYGVVPAVLHVCLICASVGLLVHAPWALLAIAGTLLTLLLVAIRNAWDLVTFMAPGKKAEKP